MFVNLRLDQFLESDVIGKCRLRPVELSDFGEIGFSGGALRVHMGVQALAGVGVGVQVTDGDG